MAIVLNRKQMQDIDRRAIEDFGLPSRLLMENAGLRCADSILNMYAQEIKRGVIVLCGSGNNGGDGYVVARYLHPFTQKVQILSFGRGNYSAETRANRELCEKLGIPILQITEASDADQVDLEGFTLLIDAIYGIGFRGDLPAEVAGIFAKLSTMEHKRIALDIASGIDADTGCGSSLKMDTTLAIAALKYGHLLGAGRRLSGEVITLPIGIPLEYFEGIDAKLCTKIVYPTRYAHSHKGNYGRVMIFGGSPGYEGSVRLTALAALRSGCGLATIYSPKASLASYGMNPEIMCSVLPRDNHELIAIIKRADAICIGPGLGLDAEAETLLQNVLVHSEKPVVIDADAITIISKNPDMYRYLAKEGVILTPHKAEFCRLAAITMAEFDADPIAHARAFAEEYNTRVLIKSHVSILAMPKGLRIIAAGNDALSTGGSGDALAGVIASFAAQKLQLWDAASSAALLMGKTAEYLSTKRQSFSILPGDIINSFGEIYD